MKIPKVICNLCHRELSPGDRVFRKRHVECVEKRALGQKVKASEVIVWPPEKFYKEEAEKLAKRKARAAELRKRQNTVLLARKEKEASQVESKPRKFQEGPNYKPEDFKNGVIENG